MLLIRADASTQMGTGHVMRCLALAQAWQDKGGQVTLAATTFPPALGERLASEGLTLVTLTAEPGSPDDAQQTAEHARALGATWVIVDGYQFGAAYQRALKDAGLRVLFMDDYGHAGTYCADIVLNQNSYAHEGLYVQRASHTRLLLGPQYVLLRREFWPWRGWRRETSEVARKVLITMGGSDPDNVTLKVIRALDQIEAPGLEVTVIVGGGNPHFTEIEAAAQISRHQIKVERNVSDMPTLMAWADVAVTAGGSTCYELAFMGVPALIIVLAENQQPGAAALAEAGIAWNFGWHSHVEALVLAVSLNQIFGDAATRTMMAQCGQALIDGHGSVRIVAELAGKSLTLRKATAEDCRLLWEWANEPTVRAASFSAAPIPWEQHVAWFAAHQGSPKHRSFIGLDSVGVPVGQVRFNLQGKAAVISVSLVHHVRGMGYGSLLIRQGTAALFDEGCATQIDAYVKRDNHASLHAFAHAGFIEIGTVLMHESEAIQLRLHGEEVSSP